jgi:hypothetical protein
MYEPENVSEIFSRTLEGYGKLSSMIVDALLLCNVTA